MATPAIDASAFKHPTLDYAAYAKEKSALRIGRGTEYFNFDAAPVSVDSAVTVSSETTESDEILSDEAFLALLATNLSAGGYVDNFSAGQSAGEALRENSLLERTSSGLWAVDIAEAMRRGMAVGRALENPEAQINPDQRVMRDAVYYSAGFLGGLIVSGWANAQEQTLSPLIRDPMYGPYSYTDEDGTTVGIKAPMK